MSNVVVNKVLKSLYQIVCQQPDQLAISINNHELNYASLWLLACANARDLNNRGIKPGQIVALHLAKSDEYIIMQVACWIAGVAFMPLPLDWPSKRKRLIVKKSQCVAIITTDTSENLGITQYPVVKETIPNTIRLSYPSIVDNFSEDDLAYVIFTSGSSGEPKGVLVPFSGLSYVFRQQIEKVNLAAGERSLWLHHLGFDASIADIWVTLLAGASLLADTQLQSTRILSFIDNNKINYVDLPSPLLPFLQTDQVPGSLHTILVGGEISDFDALLHWSQKVKIVIAYGPTEVSICTSMQVFDKNETRSGLIGKPLAHLNYVILNENDKPVNIGQPGELLISGPGIAKGYIHASKNDERFINYAGKTAYRSGDVVRQLDDNYQFLGRIDRQFKCRGKLVCPEEIEHLLLDHDDVSQAYVFSYTNNIVVALVCRVSKEKLSLYLRQTLPLWMCPQQWLILPDLPRNQNQKIDREKLSELIRKRSLSIVDDPLLEHLHQVFSRDDIGYDDCLIDLDPDSLQWLELLTGLSRLGISCSSEGLSQSKTIRNILYTNNVNSSTTIQPQYQSCSKLSNEQLSQAFVRYPKQVLSTKYPKKTAIFLTGATGNLGSELLALLSTGKRRIYCLVRGGEKRLNQHLLDNTLIFDTDNIVCLDGDISKARFGLSLNQWELLSDEVYDIYHCAADTNLLKSWQQLEAVNLAGCYHVLNLMSEGQQKKLHYASTLALVVDSNWQYRAVDENNSLDNGIFWGGYAQSKWQCEQLIKRSTDANIFRFGLLTANLKSNARTSSDWFETQLIKYPNFNEMPSEFCVDFTPINFAAEMMVAIAEHSSNGTFHVCNPKPVTVNRLAEVINSFITADNSCSSSSPSENFQPHNTVLNWREDSTSPWRLFKMTNTDIRYDETYRLAKKFNIVYPEIDDHYLKRYFRFLRQKKEKI